MCGISGFNWQDEALIQSMMSRMKFRGPNDQGFHADDFASFGHVRLSIIDTSDAGHQPMYCSSREFMIVYNGEIYNSPELRERLKAKGYVFNSLTDTEVVLNSYKHWGKNCLKKFRGMFAFAIYDLRLKEIFLARDHIGIKPLYYYDSNHKFIFSSTINAIFEAGIKKSYNKRAISDFLLYNITDHLNETFFNEIVIFPKGHCAVYDLTKKKLKLYKWWDNYFTGDFKGEYREAVSILRALLSKSVKRHLLSDVPLGITLSGGIDSSTISLLTDKHSQSKISTFSAVFPGYEKDESKYIDKVSEMGEFKSYKLRLEAEDMGNDFSEFLNKIEEPLPPPSPYTHYKVLELAKKEKTTVLLEGQGADELFAGYPYFYGFLIKGLILQGKYFTALREFLKLVKTDSLKLGLSSVLFLFMPLNLKNNYFVQRSFISDLLLNDSSSKTSFFKEYYSCNSLHSSLLFHLNFKLEHLLKWGDRNSMAHSLESRVPFLDPTIMKFIFKLPEKYIISLGKNKAILRDSVKNLLPDLIYNRSDKIGFFTPEADWLKSSSVKPLLDNLLKSDPVCKDYINLDKFRKEIVNLFNGNKVDTRQIWKILAFEQWMINNTKSESS